MYCILQIVTDCSCRGPKWEILLTKCMFKILFYGDEITFEVLTFLTGVNLLLLGDDRKYILLTQKQVNLPQRQNASKKLENYCF